MIRKIFANAAVFCTLCLASPLAVAATTPKSTGDADEAKALLMKVVAAVKADKFKAIESINSKDFNDRDLYPFCRDLADSASLTHANSNSDVMINMDERNFKDSQGRPFGQELLDAAKNAKEGEIREVSYLFPKPGDDPTPVPKVTLVTPIGDIYCGVGYYKQVNF